MKKQFLLIVPFIISCTVALAQIPNASFEDWSGGEPDNWFTGNFGPYDFVSSSNTAHAGLSAAKCSVLSIFGNPTSFPFALGSDGYGVHTSTAPQAIHGWYIGNFVDTDFAYAVIGMIDNDTICGAGVAMLTNTAIYKEFIANVYYTSGTPNGDSLLIFFSIYGDTSLGVPHDGSYVIVDDLSFGLPSGTSNVSSASLTELETIFPNPSGNEAQIIYNLRESGKTDLSFYDLEGRMVKSLVQEYQTSGRYKAFADLSDLPAGTYICRLMNGTVIDFSKVVVQR